MKKFIMFPNTLQSYYAGLYNKQLSLVHMKLFETE